MTSVETLTREYFEDLYRDGPDPWGFETSPYEDSKYVSIMEALPRRSYRAALEIGCSSGVLTQRLATRCTRLLAVDVSELALAQARARCQHYQHIRFARYQVPQEFPTEVFDLILVCEVGYYLGLDDLIQLRTRIVQQLAPGGHLLLVHWTPKVEEYPLTGDTVHELFLSLPPIDLHHLAGQREKCYRLDLFER